MRVARNDRNCGLARRRGPLGLVLAVALFLGFLPGSLLAAPAWAAAAASCTGGAVNFSAHADDDLLFQSPDILADVAAGRCSRTVYVTAGDAGEGSSYWQSREQGSQAAWATMAGVSNSWTASTISAAGKTLQVRTLTSRPTISLVFMRLPDGNLYGDGFGSAGSVSRLASGAIGSLAAKDSSASYTYSSLSSTMLDVLRLSSPTLVRTQNYNGAYVVNGTSFDHWDHVAVAKVALAASSAYTSEAAHRRIAYVGYPTTYMAANVSGTPLAQKSAAFDAYCDHDAYCDPTVYYDDYKWPARQYVADTAGAAVVASAGADQSAVLSQTVTLDASGSYASGSMSYAWSQVSGPAATLSSTSAARPTFVPSSAGSYVFKVSVTSAGTTSSDSVTVQAGAAGTGNVARLAGVTATASSAATGQPASAVIDGSPLGYPTDYSKEWSSVGGKTGSWVLLTFPQAVTTDRVVLYDRPNTDDQITGCTLTFSDNSTVNCPGALNNAGGATTVSFPSRVTSSIRLTITGVSATTANIGLAEFEVYGATSQAPVANAGANQSTVINQLATLNGSASTGSGTLSYAWAQTSGPATVALTAANTVKATFTPTVAGAYAFKLTVTANGQSSTSAVTVQVSSVATSNVARLSGVVATASSGATNQTADRVIDGSALGYPSDSTKEWASVGQKAGAWVLLTFPQAVQTDTVVLYDRPNTNDQVLSGTLTFSDGSTVKVTGPLDNTGAAYTFTFPARVTTSIKFTVDSVSSTTQNVGLTEFQVLGAVSQAPLANAGPAQTVAVGTPVTLNGSASSDPSGKALTYSWMQTGGTTVSLTGATTVKPTFTPATAGTYTFKLTVSNGVTTSSATVTITVTPTGTPVNHPPVANAGAGQTVNTGTLVTLNGSASFDPDGQTLTYAWTQTAGTTVTLSSKTVAKPTFTPAAAGTYTFKLTVSDGTASASSTVTVTAAAATASNLARATGVTVTASSQNTSTGQTSAKAIDGSILGYPTSSTNEWATVGGKAGSWLKLSWSTPVTLSQIVLFDRPNTNDRITSGTLVFSDGSTVPVTSLDNTGAATTFTFTARKVTSVQLNITGVATTTQNVGLAEIQAWGVNS